ncbi:MAG: hypothetical protein IKD97_04335 [Firmicutes bacterium]|nr:hypothetical protein [Bacillota bacterium]
MITIENAEVYGWEAAIRGMRNPMNSWERSDTTFYGGGEYHDICGNSGPHNRPDDCGMIMGVNDIDLMMRLAKAGSEHAKYRRMIVVYVDITAPLYWWKEFDTYKVGTVANSCSTMHKIAEKEFTLGDFSSEHLFKQSDEEMTPEYYETEGYMFSPKSCLEILINVLNACRENYLRTKEKKWWWQMIQLLPSSYNQRRTVMLNYEVLAGIYRQRQSHKLDEWRDFCTWIETLPYSEIITGKDTEERRV